MLLTQIVLQIVLQIVVLQNLLFSFIVLRQRLVLTELHHDTVLGSSSSVPQRAPQTNLRVQSFKKPVQINFPQVVAFVTKVVNKRVPVIAGTGSNCTQEAVERTQNAKASGVDAVLSVNPYYNKPNQKGLIEHFKQIGKVGVPIVLYNIPGRTNINMTPQTVKELYESVPEIIAIKEATGNLDQASEIAAICPGITILSGDDSLTLPLMSVGASGVISVLSNLSPKLVLDIVEPVGRVCVFLLVGKQCTQKSDLVATVKILRDLVFSISSREIITHYDQVVTLPQQGSSAQPSQKNPPPRS